MQKYIDAATTRCPPACSSKPCESFHAHPAAARRVRGARARRAAPGATSWSCSRRTACRSASIEAGDRYADEVAATARGVAAARRRRRAIDARIKAPAARRSRGSDPTSSDLIDEQSADRPRSFLIVPVGFVCDHTEILFDIDVQAARTAREFATSLRRTESLNTSPIFIAAARSARAARR